MAKIKICSLWFKLTTGKIHYYWEFYPTEVFPATDYVNGLNGSLPSMEYWKAISVIPRQWMDNFTGLTVCHILRGQTLVGASGGVEVGSDRPEYHTGLRIDGLSVGCETKFLSIYVTTYTRMLYIHCVLLGLIK